VFDVNKSVMNENWVVLGEDLAWLNENRVEVPRLQEVLIDVFENALGLKDVNWWYLNVEAEESVFHIFFPLRMVWVMQLVEPAHHDPFPTEIEFSSRMPVCLNCFFLEV